jgi:hypothetical protein
MGKLCGGQGLAEEVALSFRTVLGLKECELFRRFDAFGNRALLEVFAHINYGAHDGRVIEVGSDPVDKGLVDFQDIDGKLLKIGRGVFWSCSGMRESWTKREKWTGTRIVSVTPSRATC